MQTAFELPDRRMPLGSGELHVLRRPANEDQPPEPPPVASARVWRPHLTEVAASRLAMKAA